MTNIFKLDETIVQTYKYQTKGKSPTEIQQELRKLGVKGFVVKIAGNEKENKLWQVKNLREELKS